MDTGIYYLYEYKNDQKLRNTGFLKLTQKERTCFLQINARCIPVTAQDLLSLCAFYMEEHTANAITLSDISCGNHTITDKLTISETLFPNQYVFARIDGFFVTLPHGEILAATTPDINFDTSKITFSASIDSTESPSETIITTPAEDITTQDSQSDTPPALELQDSQNTNPPVLESQDSQNTNPPVLESQDSQNTIAVLPASVRKIQRSELSCLPRRHWNIANNSFLLHGYYNYNHLLLVEEDGHHWLGVPGIYDPRESRAAELFGFTQFSDSYNQQLDLTEEECNEFGRFGYWCRYLK